MLPHLALHLVGAARFDGKLAHSLFWRAAGNPLFHCCRARVPAGRRHWASLDDHYWARKRLVVGAMLFVNVVVDGAMLTLLPRRGTTGGFDYYYVSYIAALAGLALSRSRRLDLVLLFWTIFMNVSEGFDLFPPSHFGAQVGLASAQMQQEAQH